MGLLCQEMSSKITKSPTVSEKYGTSSNLQNNFQAFSTSFVVMFFFFKETEVKAGALQISLRGLQSGSFQEN